MKEKYKRLNMYATDKMIAKQVGARICERKMTFHPARGTSAESFSDGKPSLFFLNPVIWVRDRRQ
jgi:hypothetical protein